MAKYEFRVRARNLRKEGVSVNQIAKKLSISKSTVSIWVRDIILSIEQLEKLKGNVIAGRERGRLVNAFRQKDKWQKEMDQAIKNGKKELSNLTNRELLIAGLALYWGEGSKKKRTIEFCNSDPKMIQFLLLWLRNCFSIDYKEITCWLSINTVHAYRESIVKRYWSTIINIPLSQFTGTSFKQVVNKKIYDDPEKHFGTLFIRLKNPARLYKKIIGLINGLSQVMQEEFMASQPT